MKARTRWLLAMSAAALALIATSASAESCEGQAGGGAVKLTVETSSLRAAQGEVAVTVYPDDSERFLAPHGKLLRARVAATLPVTRTCFWLPLGTYAVAVYHDQNGDHAFDRDVLGRPVEGFGFSNDPQAKSSVPAFDAVRFRLPAGGRTISLHMRYP
jgi:uncharacterized protein (DUF2141 family)